MKNFTGQERIRWKDGVSTEMEVIIDPETVHEIECRAVERYRREITMRIMRHWDPYADNLISMKKINAILYSVTI